MDCDFAVVGSGFGGCVAALRLAEKGYSVIVLEQGQRVSPADMEAASQRLSRLLWAPRLGWGGFFAQHIFRHVGVVAGVGVGGGSLVYAATLLQPERERFNDPAWSRLGVDWARDLAPHYDTARRMLGVNVAPRLSAMDEYLRRTARSMGTEATFGPVPLGICFSDDASGGGERFLDGRGPARTPCKRCGNCLTGCSHGAKNSLDRTYLYLAEAMGVRVEPRRKVTAIQPLAGGGFALATVDPLAPRRSQQPLRARNVVVAAGVLGSLRLLLRCRDELRTLPRLSNALGRRVRTNSEAVVGILARDTSADLTDGPTITSHFYPNAHTHITQNRFPEGFEFFRWQMGPLVDGERPLARSVATLLELVRHPIASTVSWRARGWHRRVSVLTVMQHLDSELQFRYRRGIGGVTAGRLVSASVGNYRVPAYIPEANRAARVFAEHAGGTPLNVLAESTCGLSVTAHILGGAALGCSPDDGVIDTTHQAFGYPGLFVVDASAIPANIGVNPSLTITALAERCIGLIPRKIVGPL